MNFSRENKKIMTEKGKKEIIMLPNRTDFLGANICTKMAVFLYAKKTGKEIIHSKDFKYKDSMFMYPLLKTTREIVDSDETNNSIIKYDEKTKEGNFRILNGRAVYSLKNDLIELEILHH